MHIADYWKNKTDSLAENKGIFKEWQIDDQIIIRKMIIMKIMNIPTDGLTYYLRRDSWLSDFSLNNSESVDPDKYVERSLLEKRDIIVENFFYKKDYERLAGFLKNSTKDSDKDLGSKKDVCDVIKELLKPDIYSRLTPKQQDEVGLFESVYFCPIELLNGYIEEKSGAEVYYTILMEQWKTANEMAANISEQRNNMNNFYVSLMSILIGGILFSDQLLSTNLVAKTVLFFTIALTGFLCCSKWVAQIDNYRKLNAAKFAVINELERHLPANVMLCEWLRTEETARKINRKVNFSEQEKSVARLFQAVVIVVPTIMLVGTWWEHIWKLIQKLLNLV